jgi:hypothetical protein
MFACNALHWWGADSARRGRRWPYGEVGDWGRTFDLSVQLAPAIRTEVASRRAPLVRSPSMPVASEKSVRPDGMSWPKWRLHVWHTPRCALPAAHVGVVQRPRRATADRVQCAAPGNAWSLRHARWTHWPRGTSPHRGCRCSAGAGRCNRCATSRSSRTPIGCRRGTPPYPSPRCILLC